MSLTIFQNEKTPFQAIKTRSSKSRKIDIFPKGLTRGFGEVVYDILERKNPFLGYKNKKFKKSKNCYFLKGVNPWFQSKNGHFSTVSFVKIQARKMSFTIFQNENTFFYAIKTRTSKSRKTDILPKGLTHGFGQKWPFFHFFFGQYSPGKSLLRYYRTKKRLYRL